MAPTTTTDPSVEKPQFVNGNGNGAAAHEALDATTAELFSSLKVNGSRDQGNGPQHDVAPNSHTQAERARTALALSHRNGTGLATPQISRPATPYTLNPPVDFDGLSWPSMLPLTPLPRAPGWRLMKAGVGTRARLEATPDESKAREVKLCDAYA